MINHKRLSGKIQFNFIFIHFEILVKVVYKDSGCVP